MSYCKHCGDKLTSLELATTHHCSKMGILHALTDGTFIVSTAIEVATGSSSLGSLGGNILGGAADSVIGGISSFFTSDDDEEDDDDDDDYGTSDDDDWDD